ncbi:hypothetical protein [Microvirga puerhi]|uniref:Uncharacterized protein n=1 Tax=Microvirga puerhi TaxID=2876078 RepID=A0ABS7VP80_9HYPH|nr:hypothetical protein [Microvirga puerhi]MBZ6077353.1 hypothetical protein [Microvirga puerhi]
MSSKIWPALILTVALASTTAAQAQQGLGSTGPGQTKPLPGSPPGLSTPAPTPDTGNAGKPQHPVSETSDPRATGSTGRSNSEVNPPGNPPGTFTPGGNNAAEIGASGRNPCFPEQNANPGGNTNPSGTPSRC